MSISTPSDVFRTAMRDRQTNHPFDRISAYKVRESRDNLAHERAVVASIADYLRARPGYGRCSILLGCTEEDKAHRLKCIPQNIAHELGYSLIPAVSALALEGVPAVDINLFIRAIKPQVDRLLADCDAVRRATARSIKPEYAALKAGYSPIEQISADALNIADKAVAFCKTHGLL